MVRKKLDQVVYEDIVEQIESGQLLEREHVTEQGVADRLEISRTPVRKAFERLVAEDYLENIDNVGVRVKRQSLDSADFQDRMNFIERLVNHYLFDLEKNEVVYEVDTIKIHVQQMEQTISEDSDTFEQQEYNFWKDLLGYSENRYSNQTILKAVQEILFDDGFIHSIIKDSRSLKVEHFHHLMQYLEDSNYAKARREIRILLNQLKLNVIENSHKYQT